MRRAIVTAKLTGAEFGLDLDVPVDVEVSRLVPVLAGALSGAEGQPYRLEAQPLGRALQPEETLAGAGVWDGAWLLLIPE